MIMFYFFLGLFVLSLILNIGRILRKHEEASARPLPVKSKLFEQPMSYNYSKNDGPRPTASVAPSTSYANEDMPIAIQDSYDYPDIWRIGANVLYYRSIRGISQERLRSMLNYSHAAIIVQLEQGEAEHIKHSQLEQIAGCLGVPVSDLLK